MGYRERAKEAKSSLEDRHQESVENREERATKYGTIFNEKMIPEGTEFWKPGLGEHLIDLLPWIAGAHHPRVAEGDPAYNLDIWVYQNVGSAFDYFVSPSSNFRNPDPISEYLAKNRVPKAEWMKIRAKRRCVYWAWVHDTPEEEAKGPQIWEVAHWFFEDKIDEIAKLPQGGGVEPFSNPDIGSKIHFKIRSEGKFEDDEGHEHDSFSYAGHKFIPRQEPIPDNILDMVDKYPLDQLVVMHPSYENIKEAFPPTSTTYGETSTTEEARTRKYAEKEEDIPASVENPCPGGGSFGVDMNKLDACAECPVWDDCFKQNKDMARAEMKIKKTEPVKLAEPAANESIHPAGEEEPVIEEIQKPVVRKTKVKVRKRNRAKAQD